MRSTCVNYQAKIQMKDARRRTTTQTRACTVLPCTRRVMISVRISPDGISTMRRHRQAVSKPMRRYLDCPRAFCSHIPCALQPHTWLGDELIAVEQAEPSLSRSPRWAPWSCAPWSSRRTPRQLVFEHRPQHREHTYMHFPPAQKTSLSVVATDGRGETNIGGKGRWS